MNENLRKAIGQIETRIDEITQQIGPMAVQGELDKVQEVSALTQELKAGLALLIDGQKRIHAAERRLEPLLKTHTKAAPTVLVIKIEWRKLGVNRDQETIAESMATDSLEKLYTRLEHELGSEILERGSEVRFGERPILSRQPDRDWVNPNTDEPYAARAIGNSGWHAITHSSTKQKIEQIETFRSQLKLPLGSISAEAVPRKEMEA